MEYTVNHRKRHSLTCEEVLNDEKIKYLLGTDNDEIRPIITVSLYYTCGTKFTDNYNTSLSSKVNEIKCVATKGTYIDKDGKHRKYFYGYEAKIKDMFDYCISEKEQVYKKIFPDEEIGGPFIISFTILD